MMSSRTNQYFDRKLRSPCTLKYNFAINFTFPVDTFLPEIYGTDVCDDKGRVEESVAEDGGSEDKVGVVEGDHLPARRHVEVVRGENDYEHVGAEEDDHQLAEDVDVEDLNVEESHCVLSEGEYVVGCADGHDDVVDEEGDEDVVEEKVVGGDVAADIFPNEVN